MAEEQLQQQQQQQQIGQQAQQEQIPQRLDAQDIFEKLHNGTVWDTEDTEAEKQMYYEKLMESGRNKNLALRVRAAENYNYLEADKKVKASKTRVQKLPSAHKEGKFISAEKDALKKLKETYSEADLCTLRESSNMRRYFEEGGHKRIVVEGNEEKPVLSRYVQNILTIPFDRNLFTDDYLSEHIHELYELTYMMEDFTQLREQYPAFFEGMNANQLIQLELRAGYAKDMRHLLDMHLRLHGVDIEQGENGRVVKIHDDRNEDKNTRKERKTFLSNKFDEAYDKLFMEHVDNCEFDYAEIMLKNEDLSGLNAGLKLAEDIARDAGQFAYYEPAITAAYKEVKRLLELRDGILTSQNDALEIFKDQNTSKDDRKICAKKIAGNNSHFVLLTKQIENYENVIKYLSGAVREIPADVELFLSSVGHVDILESVAGKAMIDGLSYDHYLDKTPPAFKKGEVRRLLKKGSPNTMGRFAEAYLSLNMQQREAIREKKKYVHERQLKADLFRSTALGTAEGNAIGSVGRVLRELMPDSYEKIDELCIKIMNI